MHAQETGLVYLVLGIDLISLFTDKRYVIIMIVVFTLCVQELQSSSVANSRASDPIDGSI